VKGLIAFATSITFSSAAQRDFYPPLRLARFGFAAAGFLQVDATRRIFQIGGA
jgi:hypothetical protein